MCDFDQRSRCGVFRMNFTLAVLPLPEWLHTVVLESTMENTKGTQSRKRPRQDNRSRDEEQCHDVSAKVSGKALDVNENDVRDQNRPGTEAVKGEPRSDEGNAQVVGNSYHVNEDDVRDQEQPGTEVAQGGQPSRADNKN